MINIDNRAKNRHLSKAGILIVIPHNPIWIGSSSNIITHPAFFRKLLIFLSIFKHAIIFRGGNKYEYLTKMVNGSNNKKIIDVSIPFTNILTYSLRLFKNLFITILYLKLSKNKLPIFFLSFDHIHLFAIWAKLLAKILGIQIISFYVSTPTNWKERIFFLISRICDNISITNHPLIASKLRLKSFFILPNIPERAFFQKVDIKDRDKKLILTVTRLTPEKRVEVAIAITIILKHFVPNVKLFIAGDGPLRPYLENLASKYGVLNKNVFFLGSISLNKVLSLMKKAGLFLYTSTSEYFPNVIVEAVASNLPVLTFDTMAYKWIISKTLLSSSKGITYNSRVITRLLLDEDLYIKQLKAQNKRLRFLISLYHLQVSALREYMENLLT